MHFFAESYLHHLDPIVLPISGSFAIRWYGLSYLAGFLLAWAFFRWMAKSRRSPMTVVAATDFVFVIIAGVLVGGRLGYALFYQPELFIGFSGSFPFWDLLAINKGGMASHGGIIGFIVACVVFGRKHGVSVLHLLDLGAIACTAGLGLGRVANFVNGELWGRVLPPDRHADPPWWSIKYPEEILTWSPATSEGAAKLAALDGLRTVVPGGDETFLGSVVAALRERQAEVVEVVRPLLTPFYPSQILQALAEGPILAGVLALIWFGPRKPGVIGSWFLIVYGILRIATERFRQPDEGVSLVLGLSRGQQLSVLMIVAGVVALVCVVRRPVERMAGLVRHVPA